MIAKDMKQGTLSVVNSLDLTLVGAVAQLVERATPGDEVPGSIPAVTALSLMVRSVSV